MNEDEWRPSLKPTPPFYYVVAAILTGMTVTWAVLYVEHRRDAAKCHDEIYAFSTIWTDRAGEQTTVVNERQCSHHDATLHVHYTIAGPTVRCVCPGHKAEFQGFPVEEKENP